MYLKFGVPAAECIPVHCNLNSETKLCLTQTMTEYFCIRANVNEFLED